MVGCMADSFARYGTPALFDQKVSTKEIEFWLDYVMSELEILSEDARWIRTGILEQHDAFTINPCVSSLLIM